MDTPVIELADRQEIFELRWSVLRPGLPKELSEYPEDDHPGIFHLAAREPGTAGRVIGCATFFPEQLDGRAGWRFRGMATAVGYRGRGIGGAVLERGIAEIRARGGRLVWCNGRTSAGEFYRRHGFRARGEEFEVPPIGPHLVFVRDLTHA